jgi:predicted nucleic acid-binding protein
MQLFIDTNILLSFYALNQEDLAELSKLTDAIDKQQVTLLFTDQIIDELMVRLNHSAIKLLILNSLNSVKTIQKSNY